MFITNKNGFRAFLPITAYKIKVIGNAKNKNTELSKFIINCSFGVDFSIKPYLSKEKTRKICLLLTKFGKLVGQGGRLQ